LRNLTEHFHGHERRFLELLLHVAQGQGKRLDGSD